MGLRFDLDTANWIAYLLDPDAPLPAMRDRYSEREAIRSVIRKLHGAFYSSAGFQREFRDRLRHAEHLLHELEGNDRIASRIVRDIRSFLADRPWTALVVPSGDDEDLDRRLGSEEFLEQMIRVRPDDPGLILQVRDMPAGPFTVLNVFPAFRTALAQANNWPGLLLWRRAGDSVFLSFGSRSFQTIRERARWVFSHLASSIGFDFELLQQQYCREFGLDVRRLATSVHFVQTSDLHLGSPEAATRLPRVMRFLEDVTNELAGTGRVVPVVTGDILDSNTKKHYSQARGFLESLHLVSREAPLIVLGNHDVRRNGIIAESFGQAIKLPAQSRVAWYDDDKVGVICLNSVVEGKLARGFIGEEQLLDLGSEIDRKRGWRDYTLVGLLHHHPTPVEHPKWYVRPFYERIFGSEFEKTDALEDGERLLAFAKQRGVGALLHGHKHIPRAELHSESIAIVGCGSSVGKVLTTDRLPYMSVNIVSVDSGTRRITTRLLAERVPGGGLVEQNRHELVLRSRSASAA